MTLCLAAIQNNEVYLLADTLLSYPAKSGKKPFHGLKIIFIDAQTAIAYAGTAEEVAQSRLYGIYKQGYRGDINILAEQIIKSFDEEVDFLIAQSGEKPAIAKVSGGSKSARETEGIYWIGDVDAARFVANADNSDVYRLQESLSNAIENSEFDTVGGHPIVARGKIEGFKFIPYMKLVSPKYFSLEEGWKTVDFGTSQSGGFGYTTVVPVREGDNGWGIFYFHGMFGEFWHINLESNVCEILKAYAKNVQEFTKIIQKETGIELEYCGSLG
ncbi:MAG: hypothetical protein OEY52_02375 [Gammaproteobacteria bacterium]|nr:hypothetical protein [Gammaproteobacteria bacterium]